MRGLPFLVFLLVLGIAVALPYQAWASPIGQTAPADLLGNGGFEEGLTGWFRPSWFSETAQVDRTQRHSGSASLRFQGKNASPFVYQEVPASPGATLQFSGFVSIPRATPGTELVVELVARHKNNGDISTLPVATVKDTGGGWAEVWGSAVMPDRTVTARLRIRSTTTEGAIYVDDVRLTTEQPANATPTAGPANATPGPGPDAGRAPAPAVATTVARIDVDAGIKVAQVGDIVGSVINEDYSSPDDGQLGRTVDAIRALTPSSGRKFAVRFGHSPTDGYDGGDGYHWLAAFDPDSKATTIAEFMDYVSRVDGEPYVVVNFGSGTAAEAAGLVAYANGTDTSNESVQLRIQQGHPEPYGIRNWIIGNEQYGYWETGHQTDRGYDYANALALNGGDPAWYARPASNPGYYAARASEYAEMMRGASPSAIKLYAPLNDWDLSYWGGPEASTRAVVSQLGPVIDGFAVHFYPADAAHGQTDEDLLASPELLSRNLDRLRSLIAQYGPEGKELGIADVEFNNRSGSNQQTHQLVNGLFVADALRVMATQGISSAYYFAISVSKGHPSGYTYFEKGDVSKSMPTYLATQVVSRHLGNQVVQSTVAGSRTSVAPGAGNGPFEYPVLTTLASLSPDGSSLYLVVVNKDPAFSLPAEIHLAGASPDATCQVTQLAARSAAAMAGELDLRESEVATEALSSLVFPPHSVTGIRIPLVATP